MKNDSLSVIRDLVKTLRSENGCPWDREQTHESIKKYLFEEAAEVADAIDAHDKHALKDELGDLLFQVVFHCGMAEEEGLFDMDDVIAGCVEKMKRRHPHVFGEEDISCSQKVIERWEQIKKQEKKSSSDGHSLMDRVPRNLFPLAQAQKMQKKASDVGFDWPNAGGVVDKIIEEVRELEEAVSSADKAHQLEELGDLLFCVVNLGRYHGLDCTQALVDANDKFASRFRKVEHMVADSGKGFEAFSIEELENFWQQAKKA